MRISKKDFENIKILLTDEDITLGRFYDNKATPRE
jgi:hypothetical protein